MDKTIKEKFPAKNAEDSLEKKIDYCNSLLTVIKGNEEICHYPKVSEKINILEETLQDDVEHLTITEDSDAMVGHKTADSSFFGYKTHIAMTEERIITAATVTTGEKSGGKELETLYNKSRNIGMEIDTIIGDAAYSEKGNIELTKEKSIQLVSRLNPVITQGNRTNANTFSFNKDAGMYVCQSGYMAARKYYENRESVGKNNRMVYFFDVEKCKQCPYKEGCYSGGKTKTYSETIKKHIYIEHEAFQESEYFKEKMKERYKIEAKNSALKHRHGYDVASSSGLVGMEM